MPFASDAQRPGAGKRTRNKSGLSDTWDTVIEDGREQNQPLGVAGQIIGLSNNLFTFSFVVYFITLGRF